MKILWFILSCLIPMGVKAGYPVPIYSHYTGAERTNVMSLYPGVGNPFHEQFDESIWNQTVKNGGQRHPEVCRESHYHHMVDARNKTEFIVPIEPRPEDEDCRCGLKENFKPTNGLKLGNLTYANMQFMEDFDTNVLERSFIAVTF